MHIYKRLKVLDGLAIFLPPLILGSTKLSKFKGGFSMYQSQIVPVKLADNEKNRKNEDTQKKNLIHIKTSSGAEVRLFQGVSPQLAQMILEKL